MEAMSFPYTFIVIPLINYAYLLKCIVGLIIIKK